MWERKGRGADTVYKIQSNTSTRPERTKNLMRDDDANVRGEKNHKRMWYARARHLLFMYYAWYGCRRFAFFHIHDCLHGCGECCAVYGCTILTVRRKRFRFMAFIEHNFVIEANEHDRIWLSCIDRHCHNSERPSRRSQRTVYENHRIQHTLGRRKFSLFFTSKDVEAFYDFHMIIYPHKKLR